jgi:hypothetical protein
MPGTRPRDSVPAEETLVDGAEHSLHEYLETIALLQQEVTRLEHELESRGERSWGTDSAGLAWAEEEMEPSHADAPAQRELERLNSELAAREETVALLLDQLSLVDEAKAAHEAEWEQLTKWVAELEQRVEGQDEHALHAMHARLADQERQAKELQAQAEQERRGWEIERRAIESEAARLRRELAQAEANARSTGNEGQPDPGSGAGAETLDALEEENGRLRALQAIAEQSAAENADALRARLGQVEDERDQIQRQLERFQDDTKREKLEFEATIAELRTRLSRASLVQAEPAHPPKGHDDHLRALEPDLRVRALRQHLLEIHQREEEGRKQRTLSTRLSRLWSRTSPR